MNIEEIKDEIKKLLKDISEPAYTDEIRNDQQAIINYDENPLNSSLLSYCFDNILGFDVQYRIAEKVNYIIDFNYKGTFASARHFKLSYRVMVEKQYKQELIEIFSKVKECIEELFMLIGEEALDNNFFSMLNEAPDYLRKLSFYEDKIEKLEERKTIIEEKCKNQFEEKRYKNSISYTPKCQQYRRKLSYEIIYDIEAYIDTFYSALEHVLTLLYPFVNTFTASESYYKKYIRNTKWSWDKKIENVCGESLPTTLLDELKRIKEVYRNHNSHGGFSREMMAYVGIPKFGKYPMYIGKQYLKGFVNYEDSEVTYEMYIQAKNIFNTFWEYLECNYKLYMMYIKSGLVVPIDTSEFKKAIKTEEDAQYFIERMWFDIDNQTNMDW